MMELLLHHKKIQQLMKKIFKIIKKNFNFIFMKEI